jgi:peptidoglycan/xylan/chitin deacetylase (PgdA/CDA1 family)
MYKSSGVFTCLGLFTAFLLFLSTFGWGQSQQYPSPPSSFGLPVQEGIPSRSGGRLYYSVNTQHPAIALTFDDGPHPEYTPAILDLLQHYGVRATFFVVGSNVRKYPEIVQRMVAEGHQVANHSLTHPSFVKLKPKKLAKEVQETNHLIEQYTGVVPSSIRPPYGAINDKVLSTLTDQYNLNVVMWSVDPEDWKKPGVEVIAQRLIQNARPGAILLAHDIHAQTVAAMPSVIGTLKSRGYMFGTVDQLLSLDLKESPGQISVGAEVVQPSLPQPPVEKPLLVPPSRVHGMAVPVLRAQPVSPISPPPSSY